MDLHNRGMLDESRPIKLNTRRPHRKTKTGCNSCKRRKIKCDEAHPECENCVKHNLECGYVIVSKIGALRLPILEPDADLNLLDLELLHLFCIDTAHTYHHNPVARRVMSISVPQLGFLYEYVMHGILAVAGLHLAKSSPQRSDIIITRAVAHHEAGLRKASVALAEFSEENASALYIFTALTFMYTLASTSLHKSDNFILLGDAGIAEWIVLSRQSYSIVVMARPVLLAGPIGPIFTNGARRAELQEENPGDDFEGAEYLRELIDRVDQSTTDLLHKQEYSKAIYELRKVYAVVSTLSSEELEAGDVFIWPYRISDKYLDLLQSRAQIALVVLAFFAVPTNKYKDSWVLENFSIHLISRIYPLIDEFHRPWIEYPLQKIGWSPEPQSYSIYGTPLS